jgi:hypothetical protein
MTKLSELLNWYSTLKPQSVALAAHFYHPEAHFKDPFNDVTGVPAITHIFDHMFVATQNPRFSIHEHFQEHQQAFVSWTFEFELKGSKYSILGGTHLKFDANGMVTEHRDYWDAAEELFQKLPLIGGPVRWLRAQFKVPGV